MTTHPIYKEALETGQIRLLCIDKGTTPSITIRLKTVNLERQPGIIGWFLSLWNQFEALSYIWGDDEKTHKISVVVEPSDISSGDGKGWLGSWLGREVATLPPEPQDFSIHGNLYNALLVLRTLRPGIPIWIDAICINQENEKEKLAQIQIMGRIYGTARKVWAFLGSPPASMPELMRWMPTLVSVCRRISNAPEFSLASIKPSNWSRTKSIYHHAPEVPPQDSEIWQALMSLLSREYFDRLWILQEITLAKRVDYLIGLYQIPESTMELLRNHAYRIREFHRNFPPNYTLNVSSSNIKALMFPPVLGMPGLLTRLLRTLVVLCRDWVKQNRESMEAFGLSGIVAVQDEVLRIYYSHVLGMLVEYTRSQKCSRAEDRIFGIAGLLETLLLDDYVLRSPEMSVGQLYVETFYRLANEDLSFSMLRMAGVDRANGLDIPTWCPNFHIEKDRMRTEEGFSDLVYQPWRASKLKQRVNRGPDSRQLRLQGVQLGHVDVFSHEWRSLNLSDSTQDPDVLQDKITHDWVWLNNCVDFILRHQSTQDEAKTENLLRQFWTTLILGQVPMLGFNNLAFEDFLRLWSFWSRATSPNSSYTIEKAQVEAQRRAGGSADRASEMLVLGAVDRYMSGKVFFAIKDETFGVAYPGIQSGDTLCVFHGATVPHILRQTKETSTWTFVGEAFVPAIMHGEAENAVDGIHPTSQTFLLV